MSEQRFSPKEFLKSRRPERFSDSIGHDSPVLDRSLLEYHLSTLTNRSDELRFEKFSRLLLERTVCPNLLPHTGPTGGGDSKADSETYPVAESLAMGWHIGMGNEAATERWGFAFSAKEDWKPKLKSDIAKIIGTSRGYTKAFFVSNQYIRDKERAQIEDDLREKYKLEVRIFDLMWILDKIFDGRFEQLAIDELGLKTSVRREIRKGPLDTEREQDLENIEVRIATALRDRHHTSGLVDDCIEAAGLARSLERPRDHVEGLYERADRLAKQFGTPHQQIQSVYDHAWTAHWWHEDYLLFFKLYEEVERRARGSRNAYDLELWTNLFYILYASVGRGELKADVVNLKARAMALSEELDRLALEKDRLSTALQARTLRLLVNLVMTQSDVDSIDSILQNLVAVVHESEPLVGYPLEPLVQILTQLGTVLGNRPTYEKLFETVVQTAARRAGEVSAARMLLDRGAQELDAEHPYEAIRMLGRAFGRLSKHESRHEVVRALYLCARAYEQVGLLWAARGTMLSAASIATNEFWTYDKVTPHQAICYNAIKWIELRLGRLPHLLAWHELDQVLRSALNNRGYGMDRLSEDDQAFDPILGMLLLRADLFQLNELVTLPDVLNNLDLPGAAVALMYALGHENEVPAELLEGRASNEAKRELFRKWRDQPAAKDLPPKPLLYTNRTVILKSNVLGCHIIVESRNESPCVDLAESILAAIESFLATGVLERMIAREPVLTVNIQPSDFAEAPFIFEVRDHDGRPHIDIRCRFFEPHKLLLEEQKRLKDRLFDLVVHVIARAFVIADPDTLLAKLFRDELVPQRALDFTTSFMAVGNVLGHKPKTDLPSWANGTARSYPLKRDKVWDNDDSAGAPEPDSGKRPTLAAPGTEPPSELLDPNKMAHNQMQTISLIRETLWNEASWCGTGFATHPSNTAPPILALLFKNASAAAKIFALWGSELGSHDAADKLRVAIVRGVSKANPYAYRVVLGSDPRAGFSKPEITHAAIVARINTMEPTSNENLNRFLDSYKVFGQYLLTHGFQVGQQMNFARENQLLKQKLVVRDAWEIGPHDIDAVAIQEDDDPIVPDGQKEVPVLRTLERRRLSS